MYNLFIFLVTINVGNYSSTEHDDLKIYKWYIKWDKHFKKNDINYVCFTVKINKHCFDTNCINCLLNENLKLIKMIQINT